MEGRRKERYFVEQRIPHPQVSKREGIIAYKLTSHPSNVIRT